ncbi:MAG: hypothetical protein ACKO9Q_23930, partial [Pirellula sp.]
MLRFHCRCQLIVYCDSHRFAKYIGLHYLHFFVPAVITARNQQSKAVVGSFHAITSTKKDRHG